MEIKTSDGFSNRIKALDPLISMDGFVVTDEKWKSSIMPTHINRLYYVLDGSGVLMSDTQEIKLESGYVYLAPCGAPCGFYGTDSVTKLFFHINLILPNGYDLFSSCHEICRLERSKEYVEQLVKWYFSENPTENIMLKGEIWRTVGEFSRLLLKGEPTTKKYSERTVRAMDFIRSNLHASLSVKQVASAVFCSQTTLSKTFKEEVGSTVSTYIEDLLMFEAQKMLLSSELTVGEISDKLGFCDQFYFSRRFQKRFSASPRAYRRNVGQT